MKRCLNAAFCSRVKSCTAVCLHFHAFISKIMQFAKISSSTVPALKIKVLGQIDLL